jgi:hypothetical protein
MNTRSKQSPNRRKFAQFGHTEKPTTCRALLTWLDFGVLVLLVPVQVELGLAHVLALVAREPLPGVLALALKCRNKPSNLVISLSMSGSDLSDIKVIPRIWNTFIARDSFNADSFHRPNWIQLFHNKKWDHYFHYISHLAKQHESKRLPGCWQAQW